MNEVEHLLRQHESNMRRIEQSNERDAHRRRRAEERYERSFEALRQRINASPDPGAPGAPGATRRLCAGLLGALRSYLF